MKLRHLPVRIDEFSGHASLFFLSHYHGDHLRGVETSRGGPIVCSPVTARLLTEMRGIPEESIRTIEQGASEVFRVRGKPLLVRALPANHCPGALMFVFEYAGRKVVYTGDFRLDDEIRAVEPTLRGADELYVDGTYDDPRYVFPTLEESIEQVLVAVRESPGKRIIVGVYTIGKDRILAALHAEHGEPFYMTAEKRKAYRAMGMEAMTTDSREATRFYAYSRSYLDRYFAFRGGLSPENTLVVYPTGWARTMRPREGFFHVPYSEHCDYEEYCEFLSMVRAKRVTNIARNGR